LLALAVLLLVACEGPDRKALMDEVRHSVPPMAANETYFDGEIIVRISLGSNVEGAALFGGHDGMSSKMTSFKGTEGETNFGGGMGGMGGDMGGGASGAPGGGAGNGAGYGNGSSAGSGPVNTTPEMVDDHGEKSETTGHAVRHSTYQGNQGMNHIADENDSESPGARRAREAQMPPALLRLRLENPSAATVIVEIREVNSELGNFAIRPDTVTLAPGQVLEVEPMQSLLGVESYALPVTITLRAGGQTQSKILTLRPIAPAPGMPPPSAPPQGN